MKINRNLIAFLVLILFFSFTVQTAMAQDDMLQPSDFFQNFPEIKWGMSVEDAKKAIEKTDTRAIRRGETELGWLSKFDDLDGHGALRFINGKGLDEIVVQLYYSDKGKEMYEAWLKKLIEKHGETKEETTIEDVTSKVWRFKNGFSNLKSYDFTQ